MLRRSHISDRTAFSRLTTALTDLCIVADGYDYYTNHLYVTSESRRGAGVPALLCEIMADSEQRQTPAETD